MPKDDSGNLPLTDRDQLKAAAGGDRLALERILSAYWRPMTRFVTMRFHCTQDRAEDLVQEFIKQKVLVANLIGRADPSRGRFRSLLLTALQNFVIDYYKSPRNQQHAQAVEVSPTIDGDAGIAFDQEWAQSVIVNALHRMREACRRKKKSDVWRVFFKRVVEPLVTPDEVPSFKDLAQKYQLASSKTARNLMQTGRQIFHRQLLEVIREYDNPEDELRALCRIVESPASRHFSWNFDADSSVMHLELEAQSDLWSSVELADSKSLSQLMRAPDRPTPADHAGLLKSELDTAAGAVLTEYADVVKDQTAIDAEPAFAGTVEDALLSPYTSLKTLIALKEVYRHRSKTSTDGVASDVMPVLYLLAIASAFAAKQVKISKRPEASLARDIQRLVDTPWIPPAIQDHLRHCLTSIES